MEIGLLLMLSLSVVVSAPLTFASLGLICPWYLLWGCSQITHGFQGLVFSWNPWSDVFTLLTVISITWCLMAEKGAYAEVKFRSLMMSTLAILLGLFHSKSLIYFYSLFELSLIPISLLVMGWGYQPERVTASYSLATYTILGSLPLLAIILLMANAGSLSVMNFTHSLFVSETSLFASVASWTLVCGFLVKFPMYGVHLWLPKAHVEAPASGSMLLAALLLKLGGFGALILRDQIMSAHVLGQTLISLALAGGVVSSFLCLTQTDLKVLIAYSSVAHMSMVIASVLAGSPLSESGGLMMMVAHGLASSGMFYVSKELYSNTGSRNLLITKSLGLFAPSLTVWWMLICVANMGGPPTLNLLAEILMIAGLLASSMGLLIPIAMATFLAVAFTLVLYTSSQHGQTSSSGNLTAPSNPVSIYLASTHAASTWLSVLCVSLM